MAAGFTECCTGFVCLGAPTRNCYCDRNCYVLGDCCDDIDEICPGPTTLQSFGRYSWVYKAHYNIHVHKPSVFFLLVIGSGLAH